MKKFVALPMKEKRLIMHGKMITLTFFEFYKVYIKNQDNSFFILNKFSDRRSPFSKDWNIAFLAESTKIEYAIFPHKSPGQKPILRKIKWRVQNGRITKNGVWPVTTVFL